VQSLVEQLKNNSNQIQFWDEINTFFESFGLFNGGKGNYDKSVINTLANGVEYYEMTTIKHGKIGIVQPRISMFGSGHPAKFISFLNAEGKLTADGFISRFLLYHPTVKLTSLRKYIF
jgi:hypothetical protein